VEYPYLLPNFIIAVLGTVDFILISLYFKETLQESDTSTKASQGGTMSLLQEPNVKEVLIIYSIQSVCQTLFLEIMPLWCWSSTSNGGLLFDPHQIGILLTLSNLSLILFSRRLCEHLSTSKGLRWVVVCSCICLVPLCILMPFQSLLLPMKYVTWVSLMVSCTVSGYINYQIFNAQFLLLNNTVERARRGRINGIGMSIGSISKASGPFVGGPLFALSSTAGLPYPLNYTFTFNLLAAFYAFQWKIAKGLSPELEESPDVRYSRLPSDETQT
jgi:hypothetical protein